MILELEKRSTRSQSLENSLWKRLRTCRKTNYAMNEDRQSAIKLCTKDLHFMCGALNKPTCMLLHPVRWNISNNIYLVFMYWYVRADNVCCVIRKDHWWKQQNHSFRVILCKHRWTTFTVQPRCITFKQAQTSNHGVSNTVMESRLQSINFMHPAHYANLVIKDLVVTPAALRFTGFRNNT
jgi:hypothetical protein